jgi:hypothetical protein
VGVAARALLDAANRGTLSRCDVEALAQEWLAVTGGDLALAVLDGDDDHLAARVVDLCSHVLDVLEASRRAQGAG